MLISRKGGGNEIICRKLPVPLKGAVYSLTWWGDFARRIYESRLADFPFSTWPSKGSKLVHLWFCNKITTAQQVLEPAGNIGVQYLRASSTVPSESTWGFSEMTMLRTLTSALPTKGEIPNFFSGRGRQHAQHSCRPGMNVRPERCDEYTVPVKSMDSLFFVF